MKKISKSYQKFIKKILPNATYSLALVSVLVLLDLLYSVYNPHYRFDLSDIKIGYWLFFGLIFSFITSNKTRIVFLSLTIMMSVFELCHFQFFVAFVQPIAFLQLVKETGEIAGSFWADFVKMIVPICLCIFILIALLLINSFYERRNLLAKSKLAIWLIIAILLGSGIRTHFLLKREKLLNKHAMELIPTEGRHSAHNLFRSMKYFFFGIVPRKIYGDVSLFNVAEAPRPGFGKKAKNVVLIIGESLRAKQLTILGYPEATTPLLSQVKDLYGKTILSGGTMTITSMATIINRLEYPGASAQIASQNNCLFKLAKNNGYRTYFMSTQTGGALNLIDTLICRSHIDTYFNRDSFSKKKYPLPDFDIGLIDYLKLVDESHDNFIVLHQRGSHTPHDEQYPNEFAKFPAAYDNTVLYTDHVLNEVFQAIQNNLENETYVFFTSDHGEVLYEDDEKLFGHGWFKQQVYEVPFLFKAFHADDSIISANELDHVFSHFDVSTLVAKSLGYNVDVDKNPSRIVYVNGSDIDALAGYMRFHIQDKEIKDKKIIR